MDSLAPVLVYFCPSDKSQGGKFDVHPTLSSSKKDIKEKEFNGREKCG
jgi:hypothetical protein